jgi:hypothetical protein
MTQIDQPNHRQQRAIDAIEHVALEFDIAIHVHVPKGELAREARATIRALAEALKRAIMRDET